MNKAQELVAKHGNILFSKTYCPFCQRAKRALDDCGITYHAVELNLASDPSVETQLKDWTGLYTVPQYFHGGKLVGGSDQVVSFLPTL